MSFSEGEVYDSWSVAVSGEMGKFPRFVLEGEFFFVYPLDDPSGVTLVPSDGVGVFLGLRSVP